jgi:hypothetical protein
LSNEDDELAERRAVRAKLTLEKRQEEREAMDDHLSGLARQKEKTLRLRKLRIEAEERQAKASAKAASGAKVKTAPKSARKA